MSCTYIRAPEWPAKDPDSKELYAVDFNERLTRWWEPRTDYGAGIRVRSRTKAGFEYEVTTAGQSGLGEPAWPKVTGGTVSDGSVTWTCRAISTGSLKATISSVTWTTDLTVADDVVANQIATATLDGGEDGQAYEVLVTALLSNGEELAIRCALPVAKAQHPCI